MHLSLAAMVLATCVALAQDAPDDPSVPFRADLERAREDYAAALEANAALLRDGRMKEATAALLDVVPAERRTAAHAFTLGNVLFDMEPEVALTLHEEAYAKVPTIGPVAFEWAVELHRAGRLDEAERLYGFLEKDDALTGTHAVIAALRAECLLRLGRAREALASWRRIDASSRDVAGRIEEAACWIHHGESPFARRDALLALVAAKDVDAAEELILLDLDFERDWWNGGVHREYLEADLERIRSTFAADDERVRQALEFGRVRLEREQSLTARLRRPQGPAATAETERRLRELRLIGDDATLPASTRLVGEWMRVLVDAGLADGAALLARHGAELKRRGQDGDVVALETLAALLEMTDDPELAAVDRIGFERTESVRFAESLLQAKVDTIRPDDPDLARAASRFPDDPRITRFVVVAARNAGEPAAKQTAAHVAASFRRPFTTGGMDALFDLLERSLAEN